MNQLYAEASVKRKETAATMMLRVLLVIGIVAGVICLTFGGFMSIVGVILIVAMLYFFPKLQVEYEYIFVDGQIDFDKIIGKSKRKSILKTDLEKAEYLNTLYIPLDTAHMKSNQYPKCFVLTPSLTLPLSR